MSNPVGAFKISRLVVAMAIIPALMMMASPLAASAANNISEAATFPVNGQSAGLTSININPQKVGDLVTLATQVHSQSITVQSVTSAETGTWHLATRYVDALNKIITEEVWWAVATATGPTSVTVTFSASVASLSPELVADSFTSGTPSTWSFVSGGGAAAQSTTAVTFPAVTSSSSPNQLYWGYAELAQTGVAGSTPGFAYSLTADANLIIHNASLSPNTTYTPTASQTPSGNETAIAAIFAATPVASSTVTFNANGGTGSMANEVASSPTALTPNAFSETGYSFAGWNTAANGTGTAYANAASYPFTASATLYAQWTPVVSSTVTFNANGGTGSMANESAGAPTALTPNAFTFAGHTFTGWNTAANGTGTAYANAASYPFTASATLYAQWSTSTGTITKVQSGDAGTSATASGAAMTVLPANAAVGDTVVVAVLGAGSTGQTVTALTSPMGTFTKVTSNLQSGQSDVELWICSNVTTPARTLNVTWSGAGSGFAQATEFSGSLSAVASTPTQGTGASATGSVTTTSAGAVALVYVNTQNITVAPSSPWSNYDAGAFVYSWGESVATQIVAAPSTVNANWTLASSVKWQTIGMSLTGAAGTSHTVTFNANGGTGTMANESASSPTALTVNAFSESGFTFSGWNTAANGTGTAYANGATYPFTSSVTLYAQWTPVPSYTVTFNANGGTGSMANESAGAPTALTPNAFSETGFTFSGWNTAANGTGTAYANGATYPFTASATLYAQWTPIASYTVTFNANGGTGSMANESASSPTALTANAFSDAGFTFAGWNTAANGTGTAYANGATYPFTTSATLYAQWKKFTLTPVGTFASNGATASTTDGVSLVKAGDVLVIWIKARSTSIDVTAISGSGTGTIGTPVRAIQYDTVQHANNDDEIWFVPVTSTGAITLTFTWSASNAGVLCEYSTEEFQPSAAASYSLDVATSLEVSTASVTTQFPTLTPASAGELYVGYNSNNTSGTYTSPTTSGYTGASSSNGDAIIYGPNLSSSVQSPFMTATSQVSVQSSIGALIKATPNS